MSSYLTYELPGKIDLLSLHELNRERYPCLLESVAHGPQGRFDILFGFPQDTFVRCAGEEGRFLEKLEQAFQDNKTSDKGDVNIPFTGGWFVFLSYEMAQEVEPVLQLPCAEKNKPVAVASRIPLAVIVDHQEDKQILVIEKGFEDLRAALMDDLGSVNSLARNNSSFHAATITEENPQRYHDQLARIHDYIVEGDVFQVNISRRWDVDVRGINDVNLYRQLRKTNPAPFAGIMHYQGYSILSSSPERLACIHNGIVETRPIAGTRARLASHNDSDTAETLGELIGNKKERAEHVMLIDLERNDLGRVCVPGSVKVDELMVLESYAHVHHIVSNVRGELKTNISPVDVIKAVYPGGTITGCPKVRCMEIIAELENEPRGAYTGSFGYINRNGDMDLNILIRTIEVLDGRGSFRAGAGIVFDSKAESEVLETRAKAEGMLKVFTHESG